MNQRIDQSLINFPEMQEIVDLYGEYWAIETHNDFLIDFIKKESSKITSTDQFNASKIAIFKQIARNDLSNVKMAIKGNKKLKNLDFSEMKKEVT